MSKLKEVFRLPVLEDLQDYKKSANIVIAIVYFFSTIFILYFLGMKMHMIATPIVLIVMIFLYRKVLLRDLIVFKNNLKHYIPFILMGFVIKFILSSIVATSITATIMSEVAKMGIQLSAPNQSVAASAATELPLVAFLAMVIASPIVEELMFRRVFKIVFKFKFIYFFLASLTFGLAHIIVGFTFPLSFAFIFSYLFAGLVYAYVYNKTNNIWTSIFVHILNNGLPYILMLLSA